MCTIVERASLLCQKHKLIFYSMRLSLSKIKYVPLNLNFNLKFSAAMEKSLNLILKAWGSEVEERSPLYPTVKGSRPTARE